MGCTWGQTPASVASPHPCQVQPWGGGGRASSPHRSPPGRWRSQRMSQAPVGGTGAHGSSAVWAPAAWSSAGRRARAGPAAWEPAQLRAGRGPRPPTRQLCFPPSPQPRAKPPAQATQRRLDTNQNCGALVERVRLLSLSVSSDLQHVRKSSHCAGPRGTPRGLGQRGSPWRARRNRGGHSLWGEADLGSHCCSQLKNIP